MKQIRVNRERNTNLGGRSDTTSKIYNYRVQSCTGIYVMIATTA